MKMKHLSALLPLSILAICLISSCDSNDADDTPASGTDSWARSTTAASADSFFQDVASDSSGKLYTVGALYGDGSFTFGDASVSGSYASGYNALIVKYDASGTAQWARSVSSGSKRSRFLHVAIDSSGNAYAVGMMYYGGSFTFGDYSLSGPCSTGGNPMNAVIVKYAPSGSVLWAKTVDAATGTDGKSASQFEYIKVDSSGNLYVAGWIYGSRTYTFGDQTVTGGYEGGDNPFNALLLKLDSSGNAIWARSVGSGAPNYSNFSSLAIDSSDDIYVAGHQYGNGTFAYGSVNVSESGAYASGTNALVAKYTAAGNAIWATTVTAGPNASKFEGIGVDGSGGVYAAGSQTGNGTFAYGGISVAEAGAYASGTNPLIVKFDASTGAALWARSASAASDRSCYFAVTVDSSGNAYAAGYKNGDSTLTIGGVSVTGTAAGSNYNALFAKYDSSGTVQWAQSVSSGTGYSYFIGALADSSGSLFLAGEQDYDAAYTYGGTSVTGAYASGSNAVLVKLAQ